MIIPGSQEGDVFPSLFFFFFSHRTHALNLFEGKPERAHEGRSQLRSGWGTVQEHPSA